MRRGSLAATMLLGLVVSTAASQDADPAATRDAIKQMLAATWDASPAAAVELERHYERLRPSADWRVHYAYALASMRQWQYDKATQVAEQLVEDPEAELPARAMLAWLLLLKKKHAAGLAQIERTAAALPKPEDLDDAGRLHRQDVIRRLGRMFGYLEGPASGALSEFERDSRRRRIALLLSDEEMGMFEDESRAVAEQFLMRIDEKDRVVEDARRRAEEQRAARLEAIAAEQRTIAERLEAIETQRDKLQREYDEQLRGLEERDAPLRQRYARLDAQAADVQRDLAYASAEILRIEDQLAFESDPLLRDLLLTDLARMTSLASSYSREYTRLERAAAVVERERAAIAAEQRQLENQYRRQLNEYAGEQQSLARQARRNEVEQNRLARERPRTTGQARSLESQAQAFTTYVPFPFEDARQRLLESFGR